jgi:hypothetical protein
MSLNKGSISMQLLSTGMLKQTGKLIDATWSYEVNYFGVHNLLIKIKGRVWGGLFAWEVDYYPCTPYFDFVPTNKTYQVFTTFG